MRYHLFCRFGTVNRDKPYAEVDIGKDPENFICKTPAVCYAEDQQTTGRYYLFRENLRLLHESGQIGSSAALPGTGTSGTPSRIDCGSEVNFPLTDSKIA
jgi:hypothetical protein